jgi:hypothetical protein
MPCNDRDHCTVGDMCDSSGFCVGNPKDCDDSNPCTGDTCEASDGSCVNTPLAGMPCDDGDECTLGDRCQANGTCDGTPKDCNDANQCTIDSCDPSTGDCQHQANVGVPCNDGDPCTVGDMCDVTGLCLGTPKDCDDSNECTDDTCDGASGDCVNTIDQTNPCDDGDACTINDVCDGAGTCVGDKILDANEPNDSVGMATFLGNIDDEETYPAGTANGEINPAGETDWFYYNVRDNLMGDLNPTVELQSIPSGNNYDLCVYYECFEGTGLTLSCTTGTPHSAYGMDGCCSTNSGNASEMVVLDPSCDGTTDDSGAVYVEVYWVAGPGNCTDPFSLPWGDN